MAINAYIAVRSHLNYRVEQDIWHRRSKSVT